MSYITTVGIAPLATLWWDALGAIERTKQALPAPVSAEEVAAEPEREPVTV